MTEPDFSITRSGIISDQFLQRGITTYKEAAAYTGRLPYWRNANKNNLATVFTDNCGTCSTKHALLKQLALEQEFSDLKLMVGIFKMNRHNSRAVAGTLIKYRLDYIPEAHCYLRYNEEIFDHTFSSTRLDFVADLIEEQEIEPRQIADWKVAYQKAFIRSWLDKNPQIQYLPDELWAIREQCIMDLSV